MFVSGWLSTSFHSHLLNRTRNIRKKFKIGLHQTFTGHNHSLGLRQMEHGQEQASRLSAEDRSINRQKQLS